MLLGGLWHGAGWTFVFWGFLHGCYLMLYHGLSSLFQYLQITDNSAAGRLISLSGWPLTFILTSFTWVFFRSESFDQAWTICAAMLGLADSTSELGSIRLYESVIILGSVIVVFLEPIIVKHIQTIGVDWWWHRIPFPVRGMTYAGLIMGLVVFGGATQKFIYFDFWFSYRYQWQSRPTGQGKVIAEQARRSAKQENALMPIERVSSINVILLKSSTHWGRATMQQAVSLIHNTLRVYSPCKEGVWLTSAFYAAFLAAIVKIPIPPWFHFLAFFNKWCFDRNRGKCSGFLSMDFNKWTLDGPG